MTSAEHAHVQELEGLVKRYRSRIVDLKAIQGQLLTACKMALNDRMYKDWPAIADALIAAIAKVESR